MNDNMLHMTCLCGNQFELGDYAICKCGLMISRISIRPFLMPASRNIKLIRFKNTGHHDKDMFGDPNTDPREIPVYREFTFSTEYGEGRLDECDTIRIAIKLSDPNVKFVWYHWYEDLKNLKKKIDKYWQNTNNA